MYIVTEVTIPESETCPGDRNDHIIRLSDEQGSKQIGDRESKSKSGDSYVLSKGEVIAERTAAS